MTVTPVYASYDFQISTNGFFNTSRTITSTFSATNDYQQFLELTNMVEPVPVALALVHTSLAACSFTYWTSSGTSTFSQNVNVWGGISDTFGSSSTSSSWDSQGGYGFNNGLNLLTPFSGTVFYNQPFSPLNPAIYPVGGGTGASSIPATTNEWMSPLSTTSYPPTATLPQGWHPAIPNPGQTQAAGTALVESIASTYTYNSTSGYDYEISIGVDAGIAGGVGVSVSNTYSISATTTVSTSIGTTASCAFSYAPDPSGYGGYPFFYYYDGDAANLNLAVPLIHVWLEGYCQPTGGAAHGEPAC
jgi:hypothetical protein